MLRDRATCSFWCKSRNIWNLYGIKGDIDESETEIIGAKHNDENHSQFRNRTQNGQVDIERSNEGAFPNFVLSEADGRFGTFQKVELQRRRKERWWRTETKSWTTETRSFQVPKPICWEQQGTQTFPCKTLRQRPHRLLKVPLQLSTIELLLTFCETSFSFFCQFCEFFFSFFQLLAIFQRRFLSTCMGLQLANGQTS